MIPPTWIFVLSTQKIFRKDPIGGNSALVKVMVGRQIGVKLVHVSELLMTRSEDAI